MNKIDLHMHSIHSLDGSVTTQDLITIAKESKIEYIAIADHNTTKAYQDIVDLKGVKLIPAIELDCCFQGKDFHLLGYGINPNEEIFNRIEKDVEQQERAAGIKRLAYIRDVMKIVVDQEQLDRLCPNGVYEAESVCEVAMNNPENRDNLYLKEFFPGGKLSVNPFVQFYWEYCAKGKIAYATIDFIPMEEAIALYQKQNAFIVLAHPGNNVKEEEPLLSDIINLGIDGLEVYSSYHSDSQIAYYKQKAEANHLVLTCGSDFHGKTKPSVIMGACNMPIEEENKLIDFVKTSSL